MNQLPENFWPQLFARIFKAQSPRFHKLIMEYSVYITAAVFIAPYIIQDMVPGMGWAVPQWLLYLSNKLIEIRPYVMGAGAGSIFAASTTIKDAAPPLASDKPEPETIESLTRQLRELQAERNRPSTTL